MYYSEGKICKMKIESVTDSTISLKKYNDDQSKDISSDDLPF